MPRRPPGHGPVARLLNGAPRSWIMAASARTRHGRVAGKGGRGGPSRRARGRGTRGGSGFPHVVNSVGVTPSRHRDYPESWRATWPDRTIPGHMRPRGRMHEATRARSRHREHPDSSRLTWAGWGGTRIAHEEDRSSRHLMQQEPHVKCIGHRTAACRMHRRRCCPGPPLPREGQASQPAQGSPFRTEQEGSTT